MLRADPGCFGCSPTVYPEEGGSLRQTPLLQLHRQTQQRQGLHLCHVFCLQCGEEEKECRGGRKIKGLPPHSTPSPVSVLPRTSTPVPAERHAVFCNVDIRTQYSEASLRGQQQSGSGDCFCSPDKVKPWGAQGDLRDCLAGRQLQMSWAQSRGTNPWDQGGVGHSGGSQSSSHHKRTNQGHNRSSPSSGPPRPAPSATTTSGALAASVSGHSGQGKRQPEERDRSVTKKVRYLYCWSIENSHLSACLNP